MDGEKRFDTADTCHCGANYGGSDHCPDCGCEQFQCQDCGHVHVFQYLVYVNRRSSPVAGFASDAVEHLLAYIVELSDHGHKVRLVKEPLKLGEERII